MLQQHLSSVKLIGQLPLTESDLEQIFAHIRLNPAGNANEKIDELIGNTPAILACYLVWRGIRDYDEGAYWRSLSSELGSLDVNQQAKLGRFFRNFLKQHDLLIVDIPGSLKNITPILLHGIIPREQIAQFFEQVIYPLVRKELVDPRSNVELAYWLQIRREEAKRSEELELLMKHLRRVEEARKRQVQWDLPSLQKEIQEIEGQLNHEEAVLAGLQAEVSSLHFDPDRLAGIEDDLETVQRLEREYEAGLLELASQMHALEEKHQELHQYDSLMMDGSRDLDDFDAFRRSAYTAVIDGVASTLGNSGDGASTEAQVLLTVLYDSVSSKGLSLPDDLISQVEALHATYGAVQEEGEPEAADINSIDERDAAPVLPESDGEIVIEPDNRGSICTGESLPPPHDEAIQTSDDIMEPDITVAHARASDIIVLSSEWASYPISSADDGSPLFSSRYNEFLGMYLPEDLFETPGSDTSISEEERLPATPQEFPTHPMSDPDPEPEDPSSRLLPKSLEDSDKEELLPPIEDILPASDLDTVIETPSDESVNSTVIHSPGSEEVSTIEQEVHHDTPGEQDTQFSLETQMAITPDEPDLSISDVEKPLEPTVQPVEGTPRDSSVMSRNQHTPQTKSTSARTRGLFSTLIGAALGIVSWFFRSQRK